jgi:hypothetical protein
MPSGSILLRFHLKLRNFVEAMSFGFVVAEAAHSILWAMEPVAKAKMIAMRKF